MFSDGILILEEFPREGLVNNRHVPRRRIILFGNGAAPNDWISNYVEVSRRDSIHIGPVVHIRPWRRASIHEDGIVPAVAALRRIPTKSYLRYPRDAR